MSHFTVTIRLPSSVTEETLEAEVTKALAPYQENNMGDCPKEYMKFHDMEDELLEEYNTDTTEMIKLPSGELASKYDKRFQVPVAEANWRTEFKMPEGGVEVEIPMSQRYQTFDEYAKDYHGYKRDKETGRIGYWENPNKKWDWWVIGGRWNGLLPVRSDVKAYKGEGGLMTPLESDPHKADACRIEELDRDLLTRESEEKLEDAWKKWVEYRDNVLNGNEDKGFDMFNHRMTAMNLGLIECVMKVEATPEKLAGRTTREWTRDNLTRVDIINDIDEAAFYKKFRNYFFATKTYAYLDSTGWHQPGTMGWFGSSDATPESREKQAQDYVSWLNSGDQRDWIVVVDCHI